MSRKLTKSSTTKYEIGDTVWAKLAQFVYWPAKVLPADGEIANDILTPNEKAAWKDTDYFVRFFGTYDVGQVNTSRMFPFAEGYEELKKKCRSSKFREAIQEAQQYIATGVDPAGFTLPVPAATEPTAEKGDDDTEAPGGGTHDGGSKPRAAGKAGTATTTAASSDEHFKAKRPKKVDNPADDADLLRGLDPLTASRRLLQINAMRRIGLLPRKF